MRLIFAGTPEPAVVALEKLIASHHDVVAVITRPDARKGRGRTMHPSPVKELAEKHGIEVLTPTSLKPDTQDGQALRTRLQELQPDALPVVAYGNLITPDLLDVAVHGWVNLHFSLLPAWRGAAPVQAAIAAGDRVTGATTFRINEGLDTGPILGTIEEEIRSTDTADDLLTRLAHTGAQLLVETMDGLESGQVQPREQSGEATYAHKLSSASARINWDEDADLIERLIRAHTPGPGAWSVLGGQRFKIGPVSVTQRTGELQPGEVESTKQAVFVGTANRAVELGNIQPPGKKMMSAADWARGALNAKAHKDDNGVMFE